MKHPVHTLRRIARLPAAKVLLALEAASWLLLARAALLLVPFPRIGRYLGTLQAPTQPAPGTEAGDPDLARQVRWAVNATADRSPLEMVCLPRALAAWQMLHRRGVASRLHFGAPLRPDTHSGQFETHAWLTSSGVEVTGYPVAHSCVELGFFSRALPQTHREPPMPVASR